MLLIIIRVIYAVVCAGACAAYVSTDSPQPKSLIELHRFSSFFILFVLTQLVIFVDILIPRKRIEVISAVYFGLLIGFLLSYLTNQALNPVITLEFKGISQFVMNLMFPYCCVTMLLQTKDNFRFI